MTSKGKDGSKNKKKRNKKVSTNKSNISEQSKNTTEKTKKEVSEKKVNDNEKNVQKKESKEENVEKKPNNVNEKKEKNLDNGKLSENIKRNQNIDKDIKKKEIIKKENIEGSTKKQSINKQENINKSSQKQEMLKSYNIEGITNTEEINNKENINKENINKENINKETVKQEKTNQENINKTNNKNENIKKYDKNKEKNSQKKKKKWYSTFFIFIFIIIIVLFSTIFALLNMQNYNIAKGIKIKNIDVSGLTVKEARSIIEKSLNIELMQDLNIKYEDKYEVSLQSSQIEFAYNIEEAIEKAYKVGREGNIIKDNYALLYATFFGKNIDVSYTYNQEFLNNFVDDIESKLPGVVTQVSYYIEENELIINKGTDGIGIDKEVFEKEIFENIQKRDAEKIINNNEKQEIEIPIISKKAEPINIEKIYEEIYTEPKDAYYELEPFNIYPEVNGVDLEIDLEEAKKQIEAEDKEEYRFNLKITPPEITIKSFGVEAFPNLVSSFSTKYVASNINRSKNLEIAAGKINGIVLMPGEVFSFNKVVGKRTVEEGYRDAKIYQDGAVVDGLAGGICQISSTLYNAVLLANLEIVERTNHSFTTSYIKAGKDATVVYGVKDFQFKNSRTYPIKIEASVGGGVATFKIHSVGLEEQEYEVKITPIITQSIPYTTEQIVDPTLMPGQQIIDQSGQPGYRVTTYKELIKDGVSISKDVISNDVYRPMRTIVRIGP